MRGAALLTPEMLADLASTKWGYNPAALRSLAQQQADAAVGFVTLAVALVLQLASLGVGAPYNLSLTGGAIAVAASGAVAWLGTAAANRRRDTSVRRAEKRLRELKEGEAA